MRGPAGAGPVLFLPRRALDLDVGVVVDLRMIFAGNRWHATRHRRPSRQ
jgi:hypothetical protein